MGHGAARRGEVGKHVFLRKEEVLTRKGVAGGPGKRVVSWPIEKKESCKKGIIRKWGKSHLETAHRRKE